MVEEVGLRGNGGMSEEQWPICPRCGCVGAGFDGIIRKLPSGELIHEINWRCPECGEFKVTGEIGEE